MVESRLQQAAKGFERGAAALCCPLCRGGMAVSGGAALRCEQGHSFDLSARGYVNLLGKAKPGAYDKELFLSRRAVMEQGFYDELLGEIKAIIKEYAPGKAIRVLDAGCGEGWYLRQLSQDAQLPEGCEYFGVDIVKDAVQLAARDGAGVNWCVANLARLPLADRSMDIILNLLTPANYEEFKRVLRPEGLIVKAVPGNEYLREIRECVAGQLMRKQYSNREVMEHSTENIRVLQRRRIYRRHPLTPAQWHDFLRMTPLTAGADISAIPSDRTDHITIDLELITGRL
ncbi:MAG: methyltransferase domain-containing protein [Syntrophomonadaceae bacterium]|nr:methyltransferase domain-containing protein [Syntrophomonadaceae bacterium]